MVARRCRGVNLWVFIGPQSYKQLIQKVSTPPHARNPLTRTAGAVHCRGCPRPLWAQESPLPFFLLPERTPRWLRCLGRVAPRAVQRARHQGRPSSSSGSALTTCQAHTPADHAQEHCCAVGLAGRRGSQVALHPNSSPVCVGFVGGCCTPSALHASPGRPQTTSSRGGPSRAP